MQTATRRKSVEPLPKTDYGQKKATIIKMVHDYCFHAMKVHGNSKISYSQTKAEKAFSLMNQFDSNLIYQPLPFICSKVLRVMNKLKEVLVNEHNPSYASSKLKLDEIEQFINENYLFRNG
ncbi:MAG: hypothetical protein HOO91_17740 [Bacteroidales bacterium]|nr:hypothetical protein [Bacteroidales bacterium]